MDYRSAHIRRIRANTRLKKRLAAAAVLAVAGCVGSLLLSREPVDQRAVPTMAADAAAPAPLASVHAVALRAQAAPRPIYPYSIVPGGVAGRADLARIVRSDRVVAVHYAAFEVAKANPVRVSTPRAVYVSYRKGDRVYWTARKVMLAQGETLLSDGKNEIRTRCGNRISDVPQLPVAAAEPSQEVLDTAVDVPREAADDAGVRQASYVPADGANATRGAGQSHVLTSFANGAGPVSADARPVSTLSASSPTSGGFGQDILTDNRNALPLLLLGLGSNQSGSIAANAANALAGTTARIRSASTGGSGDTAVGATRGSGTGVISNGGGGSAAGSSGAGAVSDAGGGASVVSASGGGAAATGGSGAAGGVPAAGGAGTDSSSGATTGSTVSTGGGGDAGTVAPSGTASDPASGGTGVVSTTGTGADAASPLDGTTPVLSSTDTASDPKAPMPPLADTLAPLPATPASADKTAADKGEVPEPGSLFLSGIACVGLVLARRRSAR